VESVGALTRRDLLLAGIGVSVTWTAPARATPQQTLFVIARSTNLNVLHYDARQTDRGALDPERPVVAYWIMNEEGGRREDLTWFERQFAYGWSLVSAVERRRVTMRLDVFPSREILVQVDAAAQTRAYAIIAGHTAVLTRIFVQLEPGGGLPRVRHVELSGLSAQSAQVLREKIAP
jgi:hypothetical protein